MSNVYTKTTTFSKGLVGTVVIKEDWLNDLMKKPYEPEDYDLRNQYKLELRALRDKYPTIRSGYMADICYGREGTEPFGIQDHIPYLDPNQAEVVDKTDAQV